MATLFVLFTGMLMLIIFELHCEIKDLRADIESLTRRDLPESVQSWERRKAP